jgi:hypothetical protein
MLQKSLCSAAALVAMAFLFGSAFASPLGAGTRGTVPLEPMLLQVVRCRRICHQHGRTPVCRAVCGHRQHQKPRISQ